MKTLKRIFLVAFVGIVAIGLMVVVERASAQDAGYCLDNGVGCLQNCPPKTSCGHSCGRCNSGTVCVWDSPAPTIILNLAVTNGVSPFTGWEPGTQLSATESATTPVVDIQNEGEWGTGIDTDLSIVNGAGSFAISAGADADHRKLTISAFTANIPSFAHSAVAPSTTGLNTFTLDSFFVNEGVINRQTGEVTNLRLHLKLTNSYFPAGSERSVVVDCSGSIDIVNRTMSLTLDGFVPA